MENILRQSCWISYAGALRRPQALRGVALITLDAEEIGPWATARSLPSDVDPLAQRPDVHKLIEEVVDEVNAHFACVSQVEKFSVLSRDLSDEEELTLHEG